MTDYRLLKSGGRARSVEPCRGPCRWQIEPRVHALHALSRGTEMQPRILELARQGLTDAEAAEVLTGEGYRSPRCGHVLARTVQVFR